jgi:hypothetical protein
MSFTRDFLRVCQMLARIAGGVLKDTLLSRPLG